MGRNIKFIQFQDGEPRWRKLFRSFYFSLAPFLLDGNSECGRRSSGRMDYEDKAMCWVQREAPAHFHKIKNFKKPKNLNNFKLQRYSLVVSSIQPWETCTRASRRLRNHTRNSFLMVVENIASSRFGSRGLLFAAAQ